MAEWQDGLHILLPDTHPDQYSIGVLRLTEWVKKYSNITITEPQLGYFQRLAQFLWDSCLGEDKNCCLPFPTGGEDDENVLFSFGPEMIANKKLNSLIPPFFCFLFTTRRTKARIIL